MHTKGMLKGLAVVFLSASCLFAQESSRPYADQQPVVRASGEGVVTVTPDQAILHIGVSNQAQTAEAAAAQNARQMSSVMSELKAAVGSAGEIKTIGYSLNPNYKYSRDGGSPTVIGYTASNTVEVRLNDLARIGKVIDASTKVGAKTSAGFSMRCATSRPRERKR